MEEIKTNPVLQSVISAVQTTKPSWIGIIPVNVITQNLTKINKFTMIYEINNKKERVIVIKNIKTGITQVLETAIIPAIIKPVTVVTNTTA